MIDYLLPASDRFSVSGWMEILMKFAAVLGVKIAFNWRTLCCESL